MNNIYKNIVIKSLPRLLNCFDLDPVSKTYGYGDREYWAWKIKDFANGTMQGGVHTLAIVVKMNIDKKNNDFYLNLIDVAIDSINKIKRKNGSMEEAYPQENSFCVTSLIAFDVLAVIYYLRGKLDKDVINNYIEIIRPLIKFIIKNNEKHAIISNHLATAVAAIELWNYLTKDNLTRGKELLNIIYKYQSEEGWFKEYESADPGYQTLCVYYLFYVYLITKDKELLHRVNKSLEYLKYFIHPDGTIGGLYGSRNTEVLYPAGIIGFSKYIDLKDLSFIINKAIKNNLHLLPEHIDIGNFIPLLNSYAVAALYFEENNCKYKNSLPCNKVFEKDFKDSGIFIKSNKNYYSIINYFKGGTIKIIEKKHPYLGKEDGGLFGELKNFKRFSTQQFDKTINFNKNNINSKFFIINDSYPNALNYLILRFFSLTIFKSIKLGNIFKKIIVKMLMTGKKRVDGNVTREFNFLENKIIIKEKVTMPEKCIYVKHFGRSKSIHMASSGYFLKNYYNKKSEIIEFIDV